MSETPRTDAHVRQLADFLRHPHWIEFAKNLERENRLLKAKFNVTKDSYEFYKSEAIDLSEDAARLDWLSTDKGNQWAYGFFQTMFDVHMNRQSIDEARNNPKFQNRKAQP